MGISSRLNTLNPQKLWLVMTISGVILLLFATTSGIFLGLKQNQTLVQSENRMLLRRNGELLLNRNIRTFEESLGFDERDYRLSIQSEIDHQTMTFGKLSYRDLAQCSSEFYFQYKVELCRPPPISWPAIALIFSIFIALIAGVVLLVRRLGVEIVSSFLELFKIAHIQTPLEMNFNLAWKTAFSMAENFKSAQDKLLQAEKNKAIVDVSRQVAHDIRSPLTALNFLAASLDEVAPEKRELAKRAIKRIEDIASELLQKSKPDSNSKQDLKNLIEQVVAEKKFEFQNYGVEFQTDLVEGHCDLNATEFTRLLSNLINNSVEADSKLVNISLKKLDKKLEITIADQGKGIDPSQLHRVGEAHFSMRASGNGLGVSHAKQTIESAKGLFKIESQFGSGTTVKIQLPCLEVV